MGSKGGKQSTGWDNDSPLHELSEDKFGRGDFAKRVAREIRRWRSEEQSLVVSLEGDWGCGKSTLKNFILDELEADKDAPSVKSIEYNPWQWSSSDKVAEGFFEELGNVFRKDSKENSSRAKRLAHKWDGIRLILLSLPDITDHFQKSVVVTFALLSASTGVFGRIVEQPFVKDVLVLVSVLALAMTILCSLVTPFAVWVSKYFNWLKEKPVKSLSELRQELKEELKDLERPILVVIDDLDRLTKAEIRLVVQLVKANSDFPNIVYLMLFQRSIVEEALSGEFSDSGDDYLKKIVQVELTVPAAPVYMLKMMLDKEIEFVAEPIDLVWDYKTKERWRRIFEDAIWQYFKTPRDIKRFRNSLDFFFGAHLIGNKLEVDFIDSVLIELIRLFDNEAYEYVIRHFGDYLLSPPRIFVGKSEGENPITKGIDYLCGERSLKDDVRLRLRRILVDLFPQSREGHGEDQESWDRYNRVCHKQHFPKYFQLTANPGNISSATVSKILGPDASVDSISKYFLKFAEEDTLLRTFERIISIKEELSNSRIELILEALFSVSDDLPEMSSVMSFSNVAEMELSRASIILLRNVQEISDRTALLSRILKRVSAITFPAMVVGMLEHYVEREKEEIIDTAELGKFKELVSSNIQESLETGRIWNLRNLDYLLYRLLDWTSSSALKPKLNECIGNLKYAATFAIEMTQRGSSSGSDGFKYNYSLPIKNWVKLIDIEALLSVLESAEIENDLVMINKSNDPKILLTYIKKTLRIAVDEITKGNPPRDHYIVSWNEENGYFEDWKERL